MSQEGFIVVPMASVIPIDNNEIQTNTDITNMISEHDSIGGNITMIDHNVSNFNESTKLPVGFITEGRYQQNIFRTDKNGNIIYPSPIIDVDAINEELGNTSNIPSLKTYAANAIVKNMINNGNTIGINNSNIHAIHFMHNMSNEVPNITKDPIAQRQIAQVALLHRYNAEQLDEVPPVIDENGHVLFDAFAGNSNISEIPFKNRNGKLKNPNTIHIVNDNYGSKRYYRNGNFTTYTFF